MTDFAALFRHLANERVEFVVIGGLAVISHGHVRATLDLVDLEALRRLAMMTRG